MSDNLASRPQQILNAARRLWSAKGYHAVSLREVADAAGVTLALIHHHFGRKDQLFQAVVRAHRQTLRPAVDRMRIHVEQPQHLTLPTLVESLLDAVQTLGTTLQGLEYVQLVCRHRHDHLPEIITTLAPVIAPTSVNFLHGLKTLYPNSDTAPAFASLELSLGCVAAWVMNRRQPIDPSLVGDPALSPLHHYIVAGTHALMEHQAQPATQR